jgi:hypothetical protein
MQEPAYVGSCKGSGLDALWIAGRKAKTGPVMKCVNIALNPFPCP